MIVVKYMNICKPKLCSLRKVVKTMIIVNYIDFNGKTGSNSPNYFNKILVKDEVRLRPLYIIPMENAKIILSRFSEFSR